MSFHFDDFLADPRIVVRDVFAQALRPSPPVDLAAWAEEKLRFGPTDPFPGPFNLDRFPYWRRPLECLSPDHPARVVTIRKSAQLGGTVLIDVFVLGLMDLAPASMMVTHPTVDNGRKWVANKLKQHLRNSPALRGLLAFDSPKDAKATELHFERIDQRGFVMVSGANSAPSLSQHTIRAQAQDDLSKWDDNAAGDPELQADTRSQAIEDAKILKVGTPMIEGACRISRAFLAGTQERFELPCPHCATMAPLVWSNMQAHIEATGDPVFNCATCGGIIEERHRRDMVAAGQWCASAPHHRQPSFEIWAAYSPLMSWARIRDRWLDARGIGPKEQVFLNDVAGQPFQIEGEAPEWQSLKTRAETSGGDRGRLPAGTYILTAGVDCQANRIEVGIWAFGPTLQRAAVDHVVIPHAIGSDEGQAALSALLKDQWTDAWGNQRSLDMLAIDAGYARTHVVDWAARHPRAQVMAVVGAQSDNAADVVWSQRKRVRRDGKPVKLKVPIAAVGHSAIKFWLYGDLRKDDPTDRGYVTLPAGFDDDWFEQLTSERRTRTRDRRGFPVWRWTLTSGKRNEVLDCAVYAHAAAIQRGWKRLSDDQWQALAASRDRPPEPAQRDLLSEDLAQTVRATAGAAPAPRLRPAQSSTSRPARQPWVTRW